MVLAPKFRSRLSPILQAIASRLPPYPNLYTILGLGLTLLGALAVIEEHVAEGVALIALGALLDAIDGAVARIHNMVSAAGGYLDSVCDRVSDAAITYSFLVFAPPELVAYLISVTLIYSYARARAEAAYCKKLEGVGFLERGERLSVQVAILLLYTLLGKGAALYALYAYTLVLTLAALHRTVRMYKLLSQEVDCRAPGGCNT